MINRVGLLCFRDPWGIRPLCYGSRITDKGVDFVCASESVAIDSLRFTLQGTFFHNMVVCIAEPTSVMHAGDVRSGEAILVGLDGSVLRRSCHDSPSLSPCIFEYVYFARPDTILDDVSVYASRLRMGEHLANKVSGDHSCGALRDW